MKIRLTERQYSKLIKEDTWSKSKDITPLVNLFIEDSKGLSHKNFFHLFFGVYKFTVSDVENSNLLYNTLLKRNWLDYSMNNRTNSVDVNNIIRFLMSVEYDKITNTGTVEQRFNKLTYLIDKFWGWDDTPEYSKILMSRVEVSKEFVNFIKNTYSGVEAVKRLSLFNIKTKHKYHATIDNIVNNIRKETNIVVVPKSKGYTLSKRENSMVRQLIDYMGEMETSKKTKRGFLSYIGSHYTGGQYSDFWSAVNKSGIIEKVGGGSNVTYKLGPNYEAWEEGRVVAF
tara:strand:- start:158 stop:1012 length:855 start_codon:yes stop_codon:yes gene_type:complete